ncbi:hypothetical protein A5886_002176 [Enterococcus sp. 8G7_MSG3316]|uniref:Uncharacterized protein n=1 Tax=Candidatus Enterococcus testudinis TaxID=1834191 RepID=A0A242A7T2_9ENTE|nr:hypothetical protein [Enterococcus sp. 8G7_MSG3316]OTN77096.1 hypothetical protein A5886_002176 [Enterococcus sp. 8G7_MSG3316]
MSSLKEKIVGVISKHLGLDDTYTYELTRDKSGFTVGTVDIEDFEEWTEENVGDLADSIVETLQQQLNQNQQIVLEWLKGIAVKADNAPIVTFSAFGWQHFGAELPTDVEQAYRSMDGKQDLVVMSAYVNWALEQEAE